MIQLLLETMHPFNDTASSRDNASVHREAGRITQNHKFVNSCPLEKFSSYLMENTLHLCYKSQQVNAVYCLWLFEKLIALIHWAGNMQSV
jgi:hypothetical protein